jgi:hypothetical protein
MSVLLLNPLLQIWFAVIFVVLCSEGLSNLMRISFFDACVIVFWPLVPFLMIYAAWHNEREGKS